MSRTDSIKVAPERIDEGVGENRRPVLVALPRRTVSCRLVLLGPAPGLDRPGGSLGRAAQQHAEA